MKSKIKTIVLITALGAFISCPGMSLGDSYYITDDWGGTWADAEKTLSNTDDDELCWAAASSNILEYTGWGNVGGMTTTDDIFSYFQSNFSDAGSLENFAYEWWFDGTYQMQGEEGWAQEEGSGGNFYSTLDVQDYMQTASVRSDGIDSLETIDAWMHDGYGVTIGVAEAHSITAWGFDYDPNNLLYYTGIWVTDSDDDKNGDGTRPDTLAYYDLINDDGKWYMDDAENGFYTYLGGDYISDVVGLKINSVPIPSSLLLIITGIGVPFYRRLRRRKYVQ